MNGKFDFLTSSRFWAIVIGAASIYLQAKGIFGEAEMLLIATITAGFTIVRTTDRFSEVVSSTKEPPESANKEGD
jgi:hypothetical protein